MSDKIAVRDAMGETLERLGEENDRIVVLDADLSTSIKFNKFGDAHPKRFFQMGIAEQNMTGVAAGMATFGFIPFTGSIACFSTKRACDQIRVSIAQPRLNVKIVGAYAGLFSGKTGATHQSVQDAAIMRSMPNMIVVEPCDAREAELLLREIVAYEGPVYYRATRDPLPRILNNDHKVKIGKALHLRRGKDLLIVAQGFTTHIALEAAEKLAEEGIEAGVINASSLKPFDSELLCNLASETKLVVTIENHSIIGGLGSAVCEILSEFCPTTVRRIGIEDCFGESGSNEDLQVKYGINTSNLVNTARNALNN
jgi:transketolase